MNENTITPGAAADRIKARLMAMVKATLSGEHSPAWLALESFKLGHGIGRMEGRTAPQASTNEGGAHEPE